MFAITKYLNVRCISDQPYICFVRQLAFLIIEYTDLKLISFCVLLSMVFQIYLICFILNVRNMEISLIDLI